jgi:hypothetical protein
VRGTDENGNGRSLRLEVGDKLACATHQDVVFDTQFIGSVLGSLCHGGLRLLVDVMGGLGARQIFAAVGQT